MFGRLAVKKGSNKKKSYFFQWNNQSLPLHFLFVLWPLVTKRSEKQSHLYAG